MSSLSTASLIVVTLIGSLSCSQEPRVEIWQGSVTLGATPLSIQPAQPLRVEGSTIEVCVVPRMSSYTAVDDSILLNDSAGVHPSVLLFDGSGVVEHMGHFIDTVEIASGDTERHVVITTRRLAVLADRQAGLICMWQKNRRDRNKKFVRVDISTDRPLEIAKVYWWSGDPRAAVP
jgi:hypothetical protein